MSQRTQYFRKFPIIEYNNEAAVNILRRAALNSNVKNFLTAFYTHTLNADDKVEHLAFDYYDDVDLDWVIYHANDILDPYYDVPLNDEEFEDYIIDKYQSIRAAKRRTVFYRNNYRQDEQVLSTAGYNALDGGQRKYWHPQVSAQGIVGYERANTDFTASTNKIISVNITNTSGEFNVGEIVDHSVDPSTYGTVAWANTTHMMIKDIRGTFAANNNYEIIGDTSEATATVDASTYQSLTDVIPANERVYYSPVSAFDVEVEANESRREIFLIDERYKERVNKELTRVLK